MRTKHIMNLDMELISELFGAAMVTVSILAMVILAGACWNAKDEEGNHYDINDPWSL